MGRSGHVQIKPPEYGSSISDWVQGELCDYLNDNGLYVIDPEGGDAAYSNRWEIAIPERERESRKHGESRYYYDYDLVSRLAQYLREHPDEVSHDGTPYGEEAADMLDEGLSAARENGSGFIIVEWW